MSDQFEFYDQATLLYRLSGGLRAKRQEVVFLLGSPLSAPIANGRPGVPDVAGVIELIKAEFAGEPDQLQKLLISTSGAGSQAYQAAFKFLVGMRGQNTANSVVQRAVLRSRMKSPAPFLSNSGHLSDEECLALEMDPDGWELSPGLCSLGQLVARSPDIFGKVVLTTNFDPLIQLAIKRRGGRSWRTTLHSDGDLTQTKADGCHIVHLHGYWWGSDTLHTARQLTQQRPRLKSSLLSLLRNKLLVVIGYGGWDDVFTSALFDLVRDDAAAPEILWSFYGRAPEISPVLANALQAGINRGRVLLFEGIDCNQFLPLLEASWLDATQTSPTPSPTRSNPVTISPQLRTAIEERTRQARLVEGDEEDRPPQFDLCLGRDEELIRLESSAARVIFITGIGGQGKSTLAAQYFSQAQNRNQRRLFIWRDCKEEGERFENQLTAVIERLSHGEVSGEDLARQDIASLVDILLGYIARDPILFVFDNVDHYVDDTGRHLKSSANVLIEKLLASSHDSQVVFTCRPAAGYSHPDSLSLKLSGLSPEATVGLFEFRGAPSSKAEVVEAHRLTNGHAFWLDLLAIQTAKRGPATTLGQLIEEIGQMPEDTLMSIWSTLAEREQLVLKVLAETVKPSTELEVSDYLVDRLTFNKVSKALRSLKAQNLVVVKRLQNDQRVLELHPLVRQFVRTKFERVERRSYIAAIVNVYKRLIREFEDRLKQRPSFSILQNWTQKAELDITAGEFSEACLTLDSVALTFSASSFSREYSRVSRLLLNSTDWVNEHASLKGFDNMFHIHVENLYHLAEFEEADDLLDRYAMTVLERGGRYIMYCHLRSFSKWIRGDFKAAVEWGKMGAAELEKSKSRPAAEVDIGHTLALAQRDAGEPEVALPFFLHKRALSDAIDPEELNEAGGGPYYGNIGRCLHFMGQTDSALVCYQKSALLIEKYSRNHEILNQGYIRRWVGELLIARGQRRLGSQFLEAAGKKWNKVSPLMEAQLRELQKHLSPSAVEVAESEEELENTFRGWVMGDYLDDEVV